MIVFLYIIFIILAGLLISVIMPEFLNDMNVGFCLFIIILFSACAFVIMLRKRFSFFKNLSDYIAILLSLSIVAEGVLIYFSQSDLPNGSEQAIIVAGSGLFVESRLTSELEERIDKALEIHMDFPNLPIVLSGGTDKNRSLPQCVAMQSYLDKQVKALGIATPTVITEDTSSGIIENVVNSFDKSGAESAYIIVSRHNTARTKLIADRISPDSTVIAADYPLSKYIIYYIRELGFALKSLVCDGIID